MTDQPLERAIPASIRRRVSDGRTLLIRGVRVNQLSRVHQLSNLDLRVPLGVLVALTGPWGSGTTALLSESLKDRENIDRVVQLGLSPINRSARSNVAIGAGLFGSIRELFAGVQEARDRGYAAGWFSFGLKGGRCEHCKGDGTLRIKRQVAPDVFVPCEVCGGKRYNREASEILYHGKSISGVLEMTIEEAVEFFASVPKLRGRLQALSDAGLDHVSLGQPSTSLSGGEAQRLRLAIELSRRDTGRTMYVLDAPATALPRADAEKLLVVLNLLVNRGNTVLVLQNDLEWIRKADWVIEVAPGGPAAGVRVVAEGTPETVATTDGSMIAEDLHRALRTEEAISSPIAAHSAMAGEAASWPRGLAATTSGPAGWLPVLTLCASVGLLFVAIGMTLARLDVPGGLFGFWLGLAILVVPVAGRLLSESASRAERLGLVLVVSLALYFVKLMNSPVSFTFYDELLHWATLDDIVTSGRLFQENPLLPISPSFPGLEIATTAIVELTGLSYWLAGTALVGLVRVIVAATLFMFVDRITRSARTAGIAAFVYMSNPAFVYFDAQFAYESLALAFAFVALLAVARRGDLQARERRPWTVVACLAIVAGVMTHHLTMYGLIAFLLLWELCAVILERRWVSASGPGWLAAGAMLAAGAWVALVATQTISYLGTPLLESATAIIRLALSGEGGRELFVSESGSVAPLWERVTGIAGALTFTAVIPFGLWRVWQRRDRRSWASSVGWALALVALAYPATVALRLTSGGEQASTRSSALLFVGVGFIVALALRSVRLRARPGRRVLITGVAGIAFAGGIIVGWPPFGRLPGPYLVVADSRSIDVQGTAAAEWARVNLGEGNRIAADRPNQLLMGSYGRQRIVWWVMDQIDPSSVFLTPELGADQLAILRDARIEFLVVDLRLSRSRPQIGFYYDPEEVRPFGSAPLPIAAFEKFDRTRGVSRIFDGGEIRIYDVSELARVR